MLRGLRSLLTSTKSVRLTSLSTVYRRSVPRGRMLLLLAVSLKASPTEASVLACSQRSDPDRGRSTAVGTDT